VFGYRGSVGVVVCGWGELRGGGGGGGGGGVGLLAQAKNGDKQFWKQKVSCNQ